MFALSVLVIFWSIVGECTSPTCSGDEATCESINGCGWSDGDSGYCSGPSCDSAKSQSTCTAIDNCAWHSTGGACSRPTSQYCRALEATQCSAANSGCRWVAPSSQCSGPTYEQCDAKTETQCTAENGCKWNSYSSTGSCQNDYTKNNACNGLSPTACKDNSGCQWQPGQCNYTGCEGLAKNACEANDKCYYRPPRGGCRSPPKSNICTNLNPTICKMTASCSYSEDQYYCYYSNGSHCGMPSADVDGQLTCGPGCTPKLNSYGYCQENYIYCSSNTDNTDCSESSKEKGCFWDENVEREYCGLDYGCEGLSEAACNSDWHCEYHQPQGSCVDHPKVGSCSSLDADTCSEAEYSEYCDLTNPGWECSEGCSLVWVDGDPDGHYECSGDSGCVLHRTGTCNPKDYYCYQYTYDYGYTSKDCADRIGCVWEGDTGSCQHSYMVPDVVGGDDYDYSGQQKRLGDSSSSVCVSNTDGTACADGSPSGCSFSGGSCYASYFPCQTSESGDECTEASKSAGCLWVAGNGTSGDCNSLSYPKCYKNADGTACDTSSSASYCTFKSTAGRCEVDSNLACNMKADGSGCEAASVEKGCKWNADGGKCQSSLKCYKNSNGDGCDTTGGVTGCTWNPPTSAGCRQYTESTSCTSNATGDGCSDVSIEAGCVWVKGSAASIVNVPIFLLLVLLLFNL